MDSLLEKNQWINTPMLDKESWKVHTLVKINLRVCSFYSSDIENEGCLFQESRNLEKKS